MKVNLKPVNPFTTIFVILILIMLGYYFIKFLIFFIFIIIFILILFISNFISNNKNEESGDNEKNIQPEMYNVTPCDDEEFEVVNSTKKTYKDGLCYELYTLSKNNQLLLLKNNTNKKLKIEYKIEYKDNKQETVAETKVNSIKLDINEEKIYLKKTKLITFNKTNLKILAKTELKRIPKKDIVLRNENHYNKILSNIYNVNKEKTINIKLITLFYSNNTLKNILIGEEITISPDENIIVETYYYTSDYDSYKNFII